MDLRQACHLIAETLKFSGGTLLGEDTEGIDAHVALVGAESGTVRLTVEDRTYQLVVCERERRGDLPGETA